MKIVVFNNCKSFPNGKTLAAVVKFSKAIGKFMIGKFLATNGEKLTNPVIGNHQQTGYVNYCVKLVMMVKTLVQKLERLVTITKIWAM